MRRRSYRYRQYFPRSSEGTVEENKDEKEEKETKGKVSLCEFWDEEKQKCEKRADFKEHLGREIGKYKWFSCDYGSGIRKDILNFRCARFTQKVEEIIKNE